MNSQFSGQVMIFFVVSKTDIEADVMECSVNRLGGMMSGTDFSIRNADDQYAIFTDRTSADQYSARMKLIAESIQRLELMTLEELAEFAGTP